MYQDNIRDYGRVFGGVVFPGERPGFTVAVGEDRLPLSGTDTFTTNTCWENLRR